MIHLYVPVYGPTMERLLGAVTPLERQLSALNSCREFDQKTLLYNSEPSFEAVETMRRYPDWRRIPLPEQTGLYPTSVFPLLAQHEKWAATDILVYVNPVHPFVRPERVLGALLPLLDDGKIKLAVSSTSRCWACPEEFNGRAESRAVLTPQQVILSSFLVTQVQYLRKHASLDAGKQIDFGPREHVELVPLDAIEALSLRSAEDWSIAQSLVFTGLV